MYNELYVEKMYPAKPIISIIIASNSNANYLEKCIDSLLRQSLKNIEIICLPDYEVKLPFKDPRVIMIDRKISPSEKRNLGASIAKSDYIAFIDDDAYAPVEWLETGVKLLAEETFVGGPNIIPPEDNVRQKASDVFFSSYLGSFREVYRYRPQKKTRYVDNLGTVNMFIHKNVFLALGGFEGKFWPGEDTHLCETLKKNGIRLRYEPKLYVYHHRREVLYSHVKQIWRYAKYRGISLKYGEVNYYYYVPSLIMLVVIGLIAYAAMFNIAVLIIIVGLISGLSVFAFANFYLGSRSKIVALFGVITLWASHVAYATGVIYGLIAEKFDVG